MMLIVFVIGFINVVQAASYEQQLKSGVRRFTSEGQRRGSGEPTITYDVTLVERYHSIDHDSSIDGIQCDNKDVILFSKKPLTGWKVGDVFTASSKAGCNEGIARKVKKITYENNASGRWKYVIATKEATMEEIFESIDVHFEMPEEQQGRKSTMLTASTYSKTFDFSKTFTLVDKRHIQSTLSGSVSIPVTINGLDVTVDSQKNTKTYKMSLHSGMTYSLKWHNIIKASTSGNVKKDIFKFSKITIPLMLGPIEISIQLKPIITGALDYSFSAAATADLSYDKSYTASIVFNSQADPIIAASATDTTPDALPKLTIGATMNGKCTPEIGAKLEVDVKVYGIGVCSATPVLRLQVLGTLSGRQASIQPKVIFDYSCGILIWSANGSYTLFTGKTRTISF